MTDEQLASMASMPFTKNQFALSAGFELTPKSLEILKEFPNIWSLNCRGNLVDDDLLKRLRELRVVNLGISTDVIGTGLGKSEKVSEAGLEALTKLPLQGLSLTLAKFPKPIAISTDFCKQIAAMPDLSHLNLVQGKIGDDHLRELAHCQKLAILYLQDCYVTDAGLEQIRGMTKLRQFEIVGPNISAAGAKKLAAARPDLRITANGTVIEATKPAN